MNLEELAHDAYQKRDYDKAYIYAEKLVQEDSNAKNNYLLATILLAKGKIPNAIKILKKVLEYDPNHTDAAISLSIVYNDIGHYQEGQKIFDAATNRVKKEDTHINQKFYDKHLELGELYHSYNRFNEAIEEFKKAIDLTTENHKARIKMAKSYAKAGVISKAFNELKGLIADKPDLKDARMALGMLYYSQGNIVEARLEWQKVLQLDPTHKNAKMYLSLSNLATETRIDLT